MKKVDIEKNIKLFYMKCEEHGLKVTPQRVFIYEELLKATDHPSIDDIYQRVKRHLPNISFDTVYRTALSGQPGSGMCLGPSKFGGGRCGLDARCRARNEPV